MSACLYMAVSEAKARREESQWGGGAVWAGWAPGRRGWFDSRSCSAAGALPKRAGRGGRFGAVGPGDCCAATSWVLALYGLVQNERLLCALIKQHGG